MPLRPPMPGRPRIVLVNPNTNARTTDAMVAIARRALRDAGSDIDVVGMTAPFGAPMIVDETGLRVAAKAVEALAKRIADDRGGVAAVIVSAFGDPGIEAASDIPDVPVIGIGGASLSQAGRDGRHFAVATTTPGLVAAIDARVASLGLSPGYLGTFIGPGEPLALMADDEALKHSLELAIAQAADKGARAVVIGGGPLAEIAEQLEVVPGLSLVKPISAAARAALRALSNPMT